MNWITQIQARATPVLYQQDSYSPQIYEAARQFSPAPQSLTILPVVVELDLYSYRRPDTASRYRRPDTVSLIKRKADQATTTASAQSITKTQVIITSAITAENADSRANALSLNKSTTGITEVNAGSYNETANSTANGVSLNSFVVIVGTTVNGDTSNSTAAALSITKTP